MYNRMIKGMIVFSLSLSALMAQVGPKLQIEIEDRKVNLSDTEQKGGPINYAPGDTIEYTVISKNVGDALMTEPVITDPIPAGVTYLQDTATDDDAELQYSIDGGNVFSTWPVYYTVRNAKGVIIRREATANMVTHIRWIIQKNLEAGESHEAKFQVVVNP